MTNATCVNFAAKMAAALLLAAATTMAHAAVGDFEWVVGIGTEGGTEPNFPGGIAVDAIGNTYVTGAFAGTVDFDPGPDTFELTSTSNSQSIFVAKYSPVGAFVWARSMGGMSFSTGQDIAVDALGSVYITGWYNGIADLDPGEGSFIANSPNFGDVYVVKLDTNGDFVWAYAASNSFSTLGYALALDNAGHVYVTGGFLGTVDFDPGQSLVELTSGEMRDIFVLKLDPNGGVVWARGMGGDGSNEGRSIGVDGGGAVFVTGTFEGIADFDPGPGSLIRTSGGGKDIFLTKLDANGGLVWAKTMGGTGLNEARGLAMDSASNVHITGWFNDTANFDPDITNFELTSTINSDAFVARFDANGNFVWAKPLGVPYFSRGEGIALDAAGNVITTGRFFGPSDFDPGPGTVNLPSSGSSNTFISILDASGNFVDAARTGSLAFSAGRGIAVDAQGGLHVLGDFGGTADFDPGPGSRTLTSKGESDLFVLKLDGEDDSVPTGITGVITDASIDEPIACAAVELYSDGIGERIVAVADANGRYFFEPLPAGTYTVRVLAPGYQTLNPPAIALALNEQRAVNFSLNPRAAMPVVAGRVTDAETAQPLVWVLTELFVDGVLFADSYSCGNGFYELPLPLAKDDDLDIEVQFSLPNFESESVEPVIDPVEGATVNIALEKSLFGISFLTGRVLAREGAVSTPLEGARITVRGPVNASADANNDGLYFFDTLLDGSYTVTASAEGFAGQSLKRNLPPLSGGDASFELTPLGQGIPGDLNGDGVVNAVDVQLVINAALGIAIDPSFNADVNGDGQINAVDVQLVINAALGIAIGK